MADNQENNELDALISLLDEPDKEMFIQICDKIYSYGSTAIPMLENAWENSFDNMIQQRIENIIHHIQLDDLYAELHNWAHFGYIDLLKGFILVSRFQYPDLDEAKMIKQIGRIIQDIWLELNQNLTALEKIKVINHILFDIYKFKGNKVNINAPENFYINNILDSKKGNSTSLGIIYSVMAQGLKIPVFGIDLPKHFILAYMDSMTEGSERVVNKNKVLFYINPFNKGALFTRNEIELYIKKMSLSPKESCFLPCDNIDVIRRMIVELIDCYEKAGNKVKMEELNILIKALDL